MDLPNFSMWPTTLAQADTSPPPASAPVDNSPPPASAATPGDTATTSADGSTVAPGGAADGAPASNPFGGLLFPMVLVIGVLFIFSMGGSRKEKKRKAQLLEKLVKGAKVQMVGGELGTVVEVRDDEVVVKVDENTNTRIRYIKTAVSAVTED